MGAVKRTVQTRGRKKSQGKAPAAPEKSAKKAKNESFRLAIDDSSGLPLGMIGEVLERASKAAARRLTGEDEGAKRKAKTFLEETLPALKADLQKPVPTWDLVSSLMLLAMQHPVGRTETRIRPQPKALEQRHKGNRAAKEYIQQAWLTGKDKYKTKRKAAAALHDDATKIRWEHGTLGPLSSNQVLRWLYKADK